MNYYCNLPNADIPEKWNDKINNVLIWKSKFLGANPGFSLTLAAWVKPTGSYVR